MARIRVAIADDDAGIRSALSDVLSADPRFDVVGTVANGDDLCRLVGDVAPDVVLLDVRMPGGGAIAAETLRACPSATGVHGPAVIAVSAITGAATVVSLLRAGAVGYLAKGRLSALPDMVARCAAGEVVLAVPSAAEALRRLALDENGAAPAALR
jgi:two-component system nitrate/nitrite response regulator NarL